MANLAGENERLREALQQLGEYAAALELTYGVEQEAEQLRQARELLNHAARGEGK